MLPPRDEFSSHEEFERYSGPLNWNRQQGIYIYRADRLVQWGGWNGIRGIDEHTKLARASLDFDTDLDSARGSDSREERTRRILADREKEREIARQLATIGGGAGAEYMRGRHNKIETSATGRDSQASNATTVSLGESRDAAALGLKSNTARDVLLSPLKRKPSAASAREGGPKKKTRFDMRDD